MNTDAQRPRDLTPFLLARYSEEKQSEFVEVVQLRAQISEQHAALGEAHDRIATLEADLRAMTKERDALRAYAEAEAVAPAAAGADETTESPT